MKSHYGTNGVLQNATTKAQRERKTGGNRRTNEAGRQVYTPEKVHLMYQREAILTTRQHEMDILLLLLCAQIGSEQATFEPLETIAQLSVSTTGVQTVHYDQFFMKLQPRSDVN